MVLDYSERRQVNRNRPRRQFPWGMLLTNLIILVVGFGAGIGTGWFLFHTPALPQASPKAAAAPVAQPMGPQAAVPLKPADPPLTFYDTLPKGSKQVILGTGINQLKSNEPSKSTTSSANSAQHPREKSAAPPAPPVGGADAVKNPPSPARPEAATGTFAVQIASCKTREEAEAVKAKNANVQAYIVESIIPGKGTWYRVRAGRKLDRKRADELSGKIGGQAIVIVE